MIFRLNTLYKRDSKGKIREYNLEWTGNGVMSAGFRTVAGIQGGKMVTSEWKLSEGKNIGKVNETTPSEQAEKEAIAKWEKKEEKEYFQSIEEIDTYDMFKPQLAHDYAQISIEKREGLDMISQPKLDGIRCIARKDGLYTRAGKEITTCNHIHESLIPFFKGYPNVILDGELYNHQLKSDFNKITSLVRKVKSTEEEAEECSRLVEYHVYDCVDTKLPEWKFLERIEFVKVVLPHVGVYKPVVVVETTDCITQDELDGLYSQYTTDGYEGQMVRNNSPYENKRSRNLLKRKEFITEEFNIVEVLEGQGNWSGYAKHFELELGDGRTFKSGVRGNQELLKGLLEQEVKPTWVTCRYFEKTPDGIPRFPVVIDWGKDERVD